MRMEIHMVLAGDSMMGLVIYITNTLKYKIDLSYPYGTR